MSEVELTAEQIAEHQLHTAIELWHQEDFISAITLAGAAEEILGKRLRKIGKQSSFDLIKNDIVNAAKICGDNDPNTDKLVATLLNQTRNELKHYAGDESLYFNLRSDSIELIERAIANYQELVELVPEEFFSFMASSYST